MSLFAQQQLSARKSTAQYLAKPESKYFDYSHFPKAYPTDDDALNSYNELGYPCKLQFKYQEPRKSWDYFVLECPFSVMCPVRVCFKWN
ncbi:hypothetical protein FGO68_gene12299 [Halteria grandinella]|uniref:Uncharacterized protein n=1 Tax=Halteria grandinella TaxID=5974 RepID=A0A8J8NXG4_HALGN|nr:hypothetical protein FGO68_gene12299 [Halteria grandinella]